MAEFDLPAAPRQRRSSAEQAPTIDDEWLATCVQALQADGASLFAHIDCRWLTSAATDDTAARISAVQMATGQGPGVQAMITGRPVQVPDWAEDARSWPMFAAALGAEGVGAVYALPLHGTADGEEETGSAADDTAALGVLQVYLRAPGLLDAGALNGVWLAAETVVATLACTCRLGAEQH